MCLTQPFASGLLSVLCIWTVVTLGEAQENFLPTVCVNDSMYQLCIGLMISGWLVELLD